MDRRSRLAPTTAVTLAVLTAGSLLFGSPWRWAVAGALGALALLAARRGEIAAAVLGAIGLIIVATVGAPVSSVWIAALVGAVAFIAVPRWRPGMLSWRGASWDRVVLVVMTVTVLVAAAALALWAFEQPRFGAETVTTRTVGERSALDQIIDQAQRVPVGLFPFVALLFAAVNSVAEEFVYRGIVLEALLPAGVVAAVGLQAVAFGAIHLNGFPSGWWGVVMTTAYGVVLGWLRTRTGGLAAPVAVHFSGDLVVAYLVRFGFG